MEQSGNSRRRDILFCIIIVLTSLGLNLFFLSRQWDLNGLIEAQPVESGGKTLFPANHLLYRPLGYAIYNSCQWLGYEGKSAPVLQVLTALSGALGLGLFYLALRRLTNHVGVSILAALFLATSWSWWRFSTDISYIIPAAACVAGSLAFLSQSPPTKFSLAGAGCCAALSILFWQANIFLLPAFLVILFWDRHPLTGQARFMQFLSFIVPFGILVGVVYILVPVCLFGCNCVFDVFNWTVCHGSDDCGRPPMWGCWGCDRFKPLLHSAISSFIPLWQGLGLRGLLHGDIQIRKIPALLSLLSLLVLGGWTLYWLQQIVRERKPIKAILLLLFAAASYLPFILWWDPFEPKWFVIPNLLLIAACAMIWSIGIDQNHKKWVIPGVFIALIAIANFTSTIWPAHACENPEMQVARSFTEHLTAADAFIPTDWNWFGYAQYFYEYKGEVLNLKRGPQSMSENLRMIQIALDKRYANHGSVYVMDIRAYPPDQRDYIEKNAGIPLGMIDQFESEAAFVCNGRTFIRLIKLK